MQKIYLVAGGGILLLTLGFFLFNEKQSTPATNDGGTRTPASSFSHSHGIAIDVTDASKVYIATHEGLFLLQNDKELFHVGKARDDLMGFSPHPTDANTFFSSGHPARGGNIGFQKTIDGGITWQRVSAGLGGPVDFHAMAVSAANPNVVYGFFGGKLERSKDAGASWEYARGAIAPFSLATDYRDEKIVYAATQNGVQVSKDMGDSWTSLSNALAGGAVSFFAIDPRNAQLVLTFSEKLGGMGKSVDGGTTWQKIPETFGGEAVSYLAFAASDTSTVYGLTTANSIYKSTDSGEHWTRVR